MAKLKVKSPLDDEQQAALEAEIDAEYSENDFKTVAKLSDKLMMGMDDDEIAITVSRKIKNGRKSTFLFEIDEYDDLPTLQTLLRDEYSGGEFLIEGRYPNGSWAFKESLSIEAPKSKKEPEKKDTGDFQSVLLAMQENAARASEDSRNLIMTMNQKSQEQSQQMQAQMMAQQSQNMTMMVEMMKTSKPEPAAPPMGITELMALMVSMKELQPKASDPMDLFLRGAEFGKDSGGGGDENMLQTALKTLGPGLSDMANMSAKMNAMKPEPQQAPQRPPQQGPPPVQQAPQQLAAPQPTETTQENNDVNMDTIKEFLPFVQLMLTAAASNADPDVYSNMLLDQFEPEQIAGLIVDDTAYEKLFQFIPSTAQYRPWFDGVRAGVIYYLDQMKKGTVQNAHQEPAGTNPAAHHEQQSAPENAPAEPAKHGLGEHAAPVPDPAPDSLTE